MATGYEVGMYRDIGRIARALERIADVLENEKVAADLALRLAGLSESADTDRAAE
jgi:hypothetical protein